MADPTGLTYVALAAAAASAAVGAVGAIRTSQAQAGAADYNAEVARQNAAATASQAQAASEMQHRQAEQRMGAAVAAYGASGVDTSTGSPSDVLSGMARDSTLDSLSTQYNYKLKGAGYVDQAQLDDANASNSRPAGYLSATSSLLTGAATAGKMRGGGTAIPSFGDNSYGFTMP